MHQDCSFICILKTKSIIINDRACNAASGHVNITKYGDLDKSWLRGFKSRIQQARGVSCKMIKPEYLENDRAAVTLEQLAENVDEFGALCVLHGIDVMTSDGRRRIGNADESGTSGGKEANKTLSEKVMMHFNGTYYMTALEHIFSLKNS